MVNQTRNGVHDDKYHLQQLVPPRGSDLFLLLRLNRNISAITDATVLPHHTPLLSLGAGGKDLKNERNREVRNFVDGRFMA